MTEMMLKTPVTQAELPATLSDLETMIDRQIRSFLNGDNDGEELLQGLYGHVADEPMPARLMALLKP